MKDNYKQGSEHPQWKGGDIICSCNYCGKEVIKTITDYNRAKTHFCNSKCRGLFRKIEAEKRNTIKCSHCDKKIVVSKWRRNKCKTHFCSKECQNKYHSEHISGKNNPRFKEKIKFVCPICSKEFYKLESYKNQESKSICCSKECSNKYRSIYYIQENSSNWKGGINPIYDRLRRSKNNIDWRIKCMKRDNFTCQNCGDNKGGNLNIHHIKHFNDVVKNIKTYQDGINCKELWDLNNGITLCVECHKKVHRRRL